MIYDDVDVCLTTQNEEASRWLPSADDQPFPYTVDNRSHKKSNVKKF